jgi:hypothetical protein
MESVIDVMRLPSCSFCGREGGLECWYLTIYANGRRITHCNGQSCKQSALATGFSARLNEATFLPQAMKNGQFLPQDQGAGAKQEQIKELFTQMGFIGDATYLVEFKGELCEMNVLALCSKLGDTPVYEIPIDDDPQLIFQGKILLGKKSKNGEVSLVRAHLNDIVRLNPSINPDAYKILLCAIAKQVKDSKP